MTINKKIRVFKNKRFVKSLLYLFIAHEGYILFYGLKIK